MSDLARNNKNKSKSSPYKKHDIVYKGGRRLLSGSTNMGTSSWVIHSPSALRRLSFTKTNTMFPCTMKKFEFSNAVIIDQSNPIFSGAVFYNIYKDSEFLRHSDNIETILSKSHELRQMLKQVKPGQVVSINGVWLERNTPLLVKKTGPNVIIENFEFTSNRLSGLVAAYAFDNRLGFPTIKSSEALALGLIWNNEDLEKSKLYLSAVSGTEHFYEQFQFWPLVCALRKLQLNKMTLEPVIKIARVKNPAGVRMAKELITNLDTVNKLWLTFPGTSKYDFKTLLTNLPPELRTVLFNAH